MALIKCPECGREVSDKAKACPGCGRPVTKSRARNYIMLLALGSSVFLAGMLGPMAWDNWLEPFTKRNEVHTETGVANGNENRLPSRENNNQQSKEFIERVKAFEFALESVDPKSVMYKITAKYHTMPEAMHLFEFRDLMVDSVASAARSKAIEPYTGSKLPSGDDITTKKDWAHGIDAGGTAWLFWYITTKDEKIYLLLSTKREYSSNPSVDGIWEIVRN